MSGLPTVFAASEVGIGAYLALAAALFSIGAGGLWGEGLAGGSQSQLNLLSVRDSDFFFAQASGESDFAVRNGLDRATLVELFGWSEAEFHERLAGSAIHRIGYERWLRNIAVGLGNAPRSAEVMAILTSRANHESALVREHVAWALAEQRGRAG